MDSIEQPSAAAAGAYVLSRFPLGLTMFVLVVTLLSVGLGTVVIGIGWLILAVVFHLVRGAAEVERDLAEMVGGRPIPSPYRPDPGRPDRLGQRWRRRLTDPATYRDLAYLLLQFPLGIVSFVVLVTATAIPLGALAAPLYYDRLGDGSIQLFGPLVEVGTSSQDNGSWTRIDTLGEAIALALVGAAVLLAWPAVIRATARVHLVVAELLLGPTRRGIGSGNDPAAGFEPATLDTVSVPEEGLVAPAPGPF